ncbi:DnaA ATPase domain-containing protein [Salaquimonas pukyongi]|uniref:DnaA ATPase domain-containing protein n=1 Tax=Salaquimonas pukyongi TaxID=2712698 RepID=UPI0009FB2FC9|nr:DnaA/Hda family protein [Salaquimonas pukyongi]
MAKPQTPVSPSPRPSESRSERPPEHQFQGSPKKGEKPAQLALELPVERAVSRDDLLESPANRLAVDLIDGWPDWPSNVVVLAGPVGSGKSHLAAIWAAQAGATILPSAALGEHPGIATQGNLVLEDAGPGCLDEEALFHAFNQVKAAGHFLLLTSRSFPSAWMVSLKDLQSRLRLAHLVELSEPDDELLSAIIIKLFADRQLEVPPQTVAYLVARMERSMEAAGRLVAWLDREALARGRKINRSLAAEALAAMDNPENN